MRYHDPTVTREQLDAFIERHERHFADLPDYSVHLSWWIARYSRGDDLTALAGSFGAVVEKLAAADALHRAKPGVTAALLAHHGRLSSLYRDALVFVSIALCVRAPKAVVQKLLACCQRGDPLFETVAAAALGEPAAMTRQPAFPEIFDGLYAALRAAPAERAQHVAAYLPVWLPERIDGFGFLLAHQKIGYWCLEAAGVVAALGIDDRTFAGDPHYPKDLVAFARRKQAAQGTS
jgi:hypothetical protein